MKYRRALVTGGAGFIGSHIVALLLNEGIETVVVDDFSMGRRENIPNGAVVIEADILNGDRLDQAMAGVDIVFHQAARVSIRHSLDNFSDDANVNIMGTVSVIRSLIRHQVKKLVYASSMAVYGEARYQPLDEEHPLDPATPYGIGKLASEKYCLQMGHFFGFEAVALRYFNTFGTRQTLTPYVGVITIFINRLLSGKPPMVFGDGRQVRDFVAVEDVARANILAMKRDLGGQVLNIGSGRARSVNDIADLLIRKINPALPAEHGPVQPGEPNSAIADIAKAGKLLDFRPNFDLEDKIDAIIYWNREKNSLKP